MSWKAAIALLLILAPLSPVSSSGISSGIGCSLLDTTPVSLATGRDESTDWHAYWNNEYRFQIKYPADFCVANVPNELIATGAVVTFVPTYDPSIDGAGAKTNLFAFSVTIGVTNGSLAPLEGTRSCLPYGPPHRLGGRDSSGIRFTRRYLAEGAVGNRYEKLSYVTERGGRRYEIALFVHSGNPGCYSLGAITIFDSAEITRLFEMMVGTFLPVS